MSLTTKSVTVVVTCDTLGCPARFEVTAATLTEAKSKAKASGWWFGRRHHRECVECRPCRRRFEQQVAAGIVSKDGYILDMARWDANMAAFEAEASR